MGKLTFEIQSMNAFGQINLEAEDFDLAQLLEIKVPLLFMVWGLMSALGFEVLGLGMGFRV